MKTFTTAVIALAALVATAAANEEMGGFEIRKVPGQANWEQAQDKCVSMHMRLLSPSSQDDNREVFNLMASHGLNSVWIGATNRGRDQDTFKWQQTTGKELSYRNFGEGKPDNVGYNEHCLVFNIDSENPNGGWDDVDCNVKRPFYCQAIRKTAHSNNVLN